MTTQNELKRLLMLLFRIEFSDYSTTVVSKLSLRSICGNIYYNLPLHLDRSTSTFKKTAPLQTAPFQV